MSVISRLASTWPVVIFLFMRDKTLYCIVTNPTDPSQVRPDVGYYSPKELAFKEGVSTTSVYAWLKEGLPSMRQGRLGNIRIYYQDYIQWMIECALHERNIADIPSWAFRYVRSTRIKARSFTEGPEQLTLSL